MRRCFTLVELVTVIAVMAITAGLVVGTIRNESPVQKMNRAALEFETFCAAVRYQAMEYGVTRIVVFDAASNSFAAAGENPKKALPLLPDDVLESGLPEQIFDAVTENREEGARTLFDESKSDVDMRTETAPADLKWKLPDKFALNENEFGASAVIDGEEDEAVEVFRFLPNGGATGKRVVSFEYRSIKREFEISPLTGRLREVEKKKDAFGGDEE